MVGVPEDSREWLSEEVREALKAIRGLVLKSEKIGLSSSSRLFNLELINALEIEGMLDIALAVAEGALRREESRGSHARTDFEKRVDEDWLHHTIARKGKDGPEFSKKDVDLSIWEPQERKY